MKNIRVLILIFLLVLTAPFIVRAEEGENSEVTPRSKAQVFAGIERTVANVKTVASDFRQERRLAMLKEPLQSAGRFYCEKPDKLRWEFTSPAVSGFLVNGKKAKEWKGKDSPGESFDIQQNPVIKLIADQILAWTMADVAWIEKQYAVTVRKDNPVVLRLVPRSSKEKKYVSHILISFDEDTNYVNAVEIFEKGGDSTHIRFFNMVTNSPLPKEIFD